MEPALKDLIKENEREKDMNFVGSRWNPSQQRTVNSTFAWVCLHVFLYFTEAHLMELNLNLISYRRKHKTTLCMWQLSELP